MSPKDSTIAESAPPISGGMRRLLDYTTELRASLREAEAQHRLEIAALQKKLEEKDSSFTFQKGRSDEIEAALATLQSELDESEANRLELQTEIQSLQEQIEKLESADEKWIEATSEIERLGTELTQSKTQVARLKLHANKLKQKLVERINECKRKAKEVEAEREATELAHQLADDHLARAVSAEGKNLVLEHRLTAYANVDQQLENLNNTIRTLGAELDDEKETNALLVEEIDQAQRSSTYERCQTLESENIRLLALAKEKEREAETAIKKMEEAEKVAFESRSKLLARYTEVESTDILKSSLEKAEAALAAKKEEVLRLTETLEKEQIKYLDLENKVLYSSKRDNLRDSLSRIAKRRSLGESDG